VSEPRATKPQAKTRLVYQAALREIRRRGRTDSRSLQDYFAHPRSTVHNWLTKLSGDRMIEVVGTRGSAPLYSVAADLGHTIGVSVKRRKVIGAAFDLGYRLVATAEAQRDEPSAEDFYRAVTAVGADLVKAVGDPAAVVGIGVAVSGPVEREVAPKIGTSRTASRWIPPELEGQWPLTTLHARLHDETGLRPAGTDGKLPLTLANDASAGALGILTELRMRGTSPPPRDMFYVRVSRAGVGAGIIASHRVIAGGTGLAGELGHVPLDPQGAYCPRCGKRGCLDVIASVDAMQKHIGDALGKDVGSKLLGEALGLGRSTRLHPVVFSTLRDCGWHLGEGIAAAVNILNPTLVVIHCEEFDMHQDGSKDDERRFTPTVRREYCRAILDGLERHTLGPAHRHIIEPDSLKFPPPPLPPWGVKFGLLAAEAPPAADSGQSGYPLKSLEVDCFKEIDPVVLGAAADAYDVYGDEYLFSILNDAHYRGSRR
jgi:predicted NBD/HSP70 family sugar kinase